MSARKEDGNCGEIMDELCANGMNDRVKYHPE